MPEISFYALNTESVSERCLFACKLAEKVYRSGVFPYLLTDNDEQSQQMDDLLWTFRAGSFIPHQIFTGELPSISNVVLIGANIPPPVWRNTLINLSSNCPPDFLACERILEILDNNEETKALGRQRYRLYQQAGMKPLYYNMEQKSQ